MAEEKEVGKVASYYSKVSVIAVKLTAPLNKGDKIHVLGHTTDFTQVLDSMQINLKDIEKAKKGDDVGIKVIDKARPGDKVYKMTE